VYLIAVVGWVVLAGTISYRTDSQDADLRKQVGELWGKPLIQSAPWAALHPKRAPETLPNGQMVTVIMGQKPEEPINLPLSSGDVELGLDLDQRQKGLLWYSTYLARFSGTYTFENTTGRSGDLHLYFGFPSANGQYDDFRFEVDDKQVPFVRSKEDLITATIPCEAQSRHKLLVTYSSHGLDRFVYRFGDSITEIRDFNLVATTNFDGYNHPGNTLSPNEKRRIDHGWELTWKFKNLISGSGIGIETPQKINPGPLAARISFFAPVSLGFFFFLMFIISMLKRIDMHPMNYFFLAASFFSFHLLLAYLVDHIPLLTAFVICSVVSLFLVVSYMRIAVGRRFAYLETALAQLVYLVGFGYAFFFEGLTGLAVTIGSIVTLFVVMQLTARINWSERFRLEQPKESAKLSADSSVLSAES